VVLTRFTLLTLWRPAAFRDFRKKKTPKRTWLCTGISPVRYALQTRQKSQKTWQVFSSALEKIFFASGCGFFVSNVISGGLLGHLSLALGANR